MISYFSQSDKDEGINEIGLEDVTVYAEYAETTEDKQIFRLCGGAVVDGEKYSEFCVILRTERTLAEFSAREVVNADWEWYDYEFK
ncbi:hypothetical protein FACS189490_05860 [Clostridia bacterium]|nr:hypothetical protein FACS189490_05860 [Clostridia bacterium]